MTLQNTLAGEIELQGLDCYGGSPVQALLKPAKKDTGILFQTPKGYLPARLEYAEPYKRSILLSDGKVKVLAAEHILATLFAYEVDNALIELNRTPSRSLQILQRMGLGTNIEVVPSVPGREKTLCELLNKTGVESQPAERKLLCPTQEFYSEQLTLTPSEEEGLMLDGLIRYPKNSIRAYRSPVELLCKIKLTPEIYQTYLASSKPYLWLPWWLPRSSSNKTTSTIASVRNLSFGIGHGHSAQDLFIPAPLRRKSPPDPEPWRTVLYHTLVDRLGAFALLPGRLDHTYIQIRFSDHAHDLHFLKKHFLTQ